MAEVVIAALGAIGTSVGATIGLGAIGAQFVGSLFAYAAARALTPKPPKRTIDNEPITINETGSLAGIPVVYGKVRVAPNRVFLNTSNNDLSVADTAYLNAVYTISNNWLHGISDVWFNNEKIGKFIETSGTFDEELQIVESIWWPEWTTDVKSDSAGLFTLSPAFVKKVKDEGGGTLTTSLLNCIAYCGQGSHTFDSSITDKLNDGYANEDFRGGGAGFDYILDRISYLYTTIKYNAKLYSDLPKVQLDVWGKVNYTPFRDDFYDYVDYSNAAWFSNPAAQLYDYLYYEYGMNFSVFEENPLDTESFLKTAKLLYDMNISCGTILDSNETVYNNIEELCSNSLTALVYTNGKYKLKFVAPEIDIFDANTYVIDENKIIGAVDLRLGESISEYGSATVSFLNEKTDYEPDVVKIYRPGVTPIEALNKPNLDLQLKFINDKSTAIYIASVLMAMSDFNKTLEFTTTTEALQLEPMDPVYFSHDLLGMKNEKFLVKEIKLNQDGTCTLQLTEYADIYPLELATEYKSVDQLDIQTAIYTASANTINTSSVSSFSISLPSPTGFIPSENQMNIVCSLVSSWNNLASKPIITSVTLDSEEMSIDDYTLVTRGDYRTCIAFSSLEGNIAGASKTAVITTDVNGRKAAAAWLVINGTNAVQQGKFKNYYYAYSIENKVAARTLKINATKVPPGAFIILQGHSNYLTTDIIWASDDATVTKAFKIDIGGILSYSVAVAQNTTNEEMDITITGTWTHGAAERYRSIDAAVYY